MLSSTVDRLRCPACGESLVLQPNQSLRGEGSVVEVRSGNLRCSECSQQYPILAGVAILIEDVASYLVHHVKGISRLVPDSDIPKAFRRDYLQAKSEIESEHIEEDLEAERVTALYLMNHYLSVENPPAEMPAEWWRPGAGESSPFLENLIRQYWDQGPLAKMAEWLAARAKTQKMESVIELGCGVGGLAHRVSPFVQTYLGVDSSFASIALARHLSLGLPYDRPIRIPADLLSGSVSRDVRIPAPPALRAGVDFIVGDIESLPLSPESYDAAVALNAIDMMDDPSRLPELQAQLVVSGGVVAQSCPYVWSEGVATRLRETIPRGVKDSAGAVEWLYQEAGLKIRERIAHLPWLFYKHARQLEIYSVHLFLADKG